ncbi:MAG: MmgE/PrpD family protein, partial [Rhodospirillales bacterium]|nr:MmgE/PrpD family protein [Rhodospirillales bacterium]
ARIAYADKVEVHHDAEITAKGSKFRHMVRAEVYLKDGTVLEETVESARGSEKRFATTEQVVEKFEKLARHAIPESQAAQLRDAILGLEDLKDAGEIARRLVVQK